MGPKTLVKHLAKNLVKHIAKNLAEKSSTEDLYFGVHNGIRFNPLYPIIDISLNIWIIQRPMPVSVAHLVRTKKKHWPGTERGAGEGTGQGAGKARVKGKGNGKRIGN